MKKKIIIASQSPVKIEAVKIAFKKVFVNNALLFESFNAVSNVSDQPMTSDETYLGAKNRANYSYNKKNDADFWIGIEGGVQKTGNELEAFAWVYIKSEKAIGKARTASFFLPNKISELIKQGIELGEADDIVFNLQDSKKKNGAVGILTKDKITRTSYYVDAIILALIPFINNELYK